jgi:Ca2+-binding EF-hand superfamily protein
MWWNIGPHLKKRLHSEQKNQIQSISLVPKDGDSPRSLNERRNSKGGKDIAPKTLQGFLDILRHKFGSVVKAWRLAMDFDDSGSLTFREFTHAMERVGYHGDFRSLWFQLDTDMSGSISLHEMDPVNAMRLEKFRTLCIKQCGSMLGAWRRVIDTDRSGTCGPAEFTAACMKLGYSDIKECNTLFDLLDIHESQIISYNSIEFLQCWEEEKKQESFRQRLPTRWANKDPYMKVGNSSSKNPAQAPPKVMASLELTMEEQRQLQKIFSLCDAGDGLGKGFSDERISLLELIQACKKNREVSSMLGLKTREEAERWFQGLDADESGDVSWDEFKAHFIRSRKAKEKMEGKATEGDNSKKLTRLSTMKLTLGDTGGSPIIGGVADEDWSAPATQDHQETFRHFQMFLTKKFGSLSRAFDAMDNNSSGSLSLVEFQSMVGTLQYVLPTGQNCRASDSKRLFLTTVPDGGSITWKEFGITPQEWIEHIHFKRQQEKARLSNSKGRAETAAKNHVGRTRNPVPQRVLSFGMPLPRGWGFPPNFHPADASFGRGRGMNQTS